MNDYLSRISTRILDTKEVLRPRIASRFEPITADGHQVLHEGDDEQTSHGSISGDLEAIGKTGNLGKPLRDFGFIDDAQEDKLGGFPTDSQGYHRLVSHEAIQLTPASTPSSNPLDDFVDRDQPANNLPNQSSHDNANSKSTIVQRSLNHKALFNVRPIVGDSSIRQAIPDGYPANPQVEEIAHKPTRVAAEKQSSIEALAQKIDNLEIDKKKPKSNFGVKPKSASGGRIIDSISTQKEKNMVVKPGIEVYSGRIDANVLRPVLQPEPVIEVTIGLIEVRATSSSIETKLQKEPRAPPAMSLNEYLNRRSRK